MSADNGIYILETDGPEYRVMHLQAVENMDWHVCSKHKTDYHFGNDGRENCPECHTGYCDHNECKLMQVREMWGRSPVFYNVEDADKYAGKTHDEYGWTEYGICSIKVAGKF